MTAMWTGWKKPSTKHNTTLPTAVACEHENTLILKFLTFWVWLLLIQKHAWLLRQSDCAIDTIKYHYYSRVVRSIQDSPQANPSTMDSVLAWGYMNCTAQSFDLCMSRIDYRRRLTRWIGQRCGQPCKVPGWHLFCYNWYVISTWRTVHLSSSGVRQWCIMAPAMFCCVTDWIIRQCIGKVRVDVAAAPSQISVMPMMMGRHDSSCQVL